MNTGEPTPHRGAARLFEEQRQFEGREPVCDIFYRSIFQPHYGAAGRLSSFSEKVQSMQHTFAVSGYGRQTIASRYGYMTSRTLAAKTVRICMTSHISSQTGLVPLPPSLRTLLLP
ncbi:hypothetical protein [Xanthomonas arboricola]|uniref:Uncharacterized protein n=1 Tax=Xanthomonas arboricola pv. pruni TaxID=69929 RepID=A0AAP4K7S9_9XANT|nr:hypothetical protein [Xanthomonas arboricola]MDN0273462.1 hypothetical protein [Xanthomonas arboricola pv. pruni]MDN0285830.1 hypothetical protein [Xanthomonas arboricola pv. pruni]